MAAAALFDDVHLLRRPINKRSFPVNEAAIHRPKIAAVTRDRAVISHHVIAVRRQNDRGYRPNIAEALRHIRLRDLDAVHVYTAFVYFHAIARQGDHALDVTFGGVPWV